METSPRGSLCFNLEDDEDEDISNDGLQIVLDTPKSKKRRREELKEDEKEFIKSVEHDLEQELEEKAARTNLKASAVKNILKQVVTNEDVLALVRHVEYPEENIERIIYEPKCTRAKTKQLLADNIQPKIIPWVPTLQESSAEVRSLINEELQEESDDDEYNPNEEANTTLESDLNTTSKSTEEEDGEEEEEDGEEEEEDGEEEDDEEDEEGDVEEAEETTKTEPNIALRTRSKLCLSDTPLEEIETAFIPPDITTDMYDMDCDDDEWRDFLKTFTKPLAEVTKAVEDEEQDPEYNILADEEIDKVDKEELRADRAVTVTRRELTDLMAELFEYTDIYTAGKSKEKVQNDITNVSPNTSTRSVNNVEDSEEGMPIKISQIPLLAQQMRQHVQILTQTFLLTYRHPEYGDNALKMKENLMELQEQGKDKSYSVFNAINLLPALQLIEEWEQFWELNTFETLETRVHMEKVIVESKQAKYAGTDYVPTFPKKVMETISNSEVFLYPSLLPRIPFKPAVTTYTRYYYFTPTEEHLIAILLETFQLEMKAGKRMNLPNICQMIASQYLCGVTPLKLENHIRKRTRESGDNPIKYFHVNGKPPPTVHYVKPVGTLGPPCKASKESLPILWRNYIYPQGEVKHPSTCDETNNNIIFLQPTPVYVALPALRCVKRRRINTKLLVPKPQPYPVVNSQLFESKPLRRSARNRKKPQEIGLNLEETRIVPIQYKIIHTMLPDMPTLGGTPEKHKQEVSQQPEIKEEQIDNKETELSFQNITQLGDKYYKPEIVKRNFEGIAEFLTEKEDVKPCMSTVKDNPEEINQLMIASCTVKTTKKEPSGAEKKRLKLKKEFMTNLAMATPEDRAAQDRKEENLASAFHEKLKTTLTPDDYQKIMSVFTRFDAKSHDFYGFYNDVQAILELNHKELSDEFLLFLSDIQAYRVGQLMHYFIMKDLALFMKKLQGYFREQPFHLKKVMKALTDLSENPKLNLEDVKSTILPLLKGNAALTDLFLQIFPMERPPNLLTERPSEVVDLRTELLRPPDEGIFETISLPDSEDPYGGANCICPCHNNVENPQDNTKLNHCNKCGLKFIQGKIFIQTGKALRPAVVSFLTNPEKDHTDRLSGAQRKCSDSSPNKTGSSPRDSSHAHDDHRHSNESEEDCDKKKARRRRQRGQSKKTSKEGATKVKTLRPPKTPKIPRKRKSEKKTSETEPEPKPGTSNGQQKRPAEEPLEFSFDGPAELVELKVGSDTSGESENELIEFPQDTATNTESDESSVEIQSWSREEDKIILQAFQETSNKEHTFQKIAKLIPNRQVADIRNRFHKLMALLQEMATKKDV